MKSGTTAITPHGLLEVSLLIGGAAQPFYRRSSDGALFVAGHAGQSYTLRARNLAGSRAEVIATVDGRHTLKDEPGDANANRGMVVPAFGTWDITGWRLNDDQTREFVFGAPGASIAAQATGSTSNVGVIGFAGYREKQEPAGYYSAGFPQEDGAFRGRQTKGMTLTGGSGPVIAGASNEPAPAGGSGPVVAVARNLGTGMGALQADHVGRTSFTRASGGPDVLVIHYDTEDALRMMGLMDELVAGVPSAFPGTGTGYEKYATP